jgi:hypothetical protein
MLKNLLYAIFQSGAALAAPYKSFRLVIPHELYRLLKKAVLGRAGLQASVEAVCFRPAERILVREAPQRRTFSAASLARGESVFPHFSAVSLAPGGFSNEQKGLFQQALQFGGEGTLVQRPPGDIIQFKNLRNSFATRALKLATGYELLAVSLTAHSASSHAQP